MNTSPRWLDRLAHDLRGPLMPLQTAAHLLKTGQLDARRQWDLLDLIERQARHLGRMIDELGDWTCVDGGRLLGASQTQEAAMLLDAALGGIAPGTTPPSIIDDCHEASVLGDPARLVQLLRILVEYSSARGGGNPPSLRVQRAGDSLRIDVAGGPAPDAQQLANLLEEPQPEPFDQGLGLKLLIARAIAQAHGGMLTADADPAGKLQLRCTLPLA